MNLVANKKRFLEWIAAQIEDDDIVVVTNNLSGQLTASEKTNRKNVSLAFAADAFARPGDVGHIGFGKTPVVGLCICPPEFISENAKKMIAEAEEKIKEKELKDDNQRTVEGKTSAESGT